MEPYQRRNRHFEDLVARRGLIWMGQNTNHLPTHPDVKRAMIAAIEDEDYHAYAPPTGLEELRRLILADFGVDDADVLITDGAIEGLYHACRHVIRPGQRMIATDPGWPWPEAFSRLSGAEVVALPIYRPEQDYKLSAEQLAGAVEEGGAGLIYLIDPLNPLGVGYSADEIAAFARIAREADAWLIHDCTYRHFAHDHTLAYRLYPEKTINHLQLLQVARARRASGRRADGEAGADRDAVGRPAQQPRLQPGLAEGRHRGLADQGGMVSRGQPDPAREPGVDPRRGRPDQRTRHAGLPVERQFRRHRHRRGRHRAGDPLRALPGTRHHDPPGGISVESCLPTAS